MAIEQTRVIGVGADSRQTKVLDQARKGAVEGLVARGFCGCVLGLLPSVIAASRELGRLVVQAAALPLGAVCRGREETDGFLATRTRPRPPSRMQDQYVGDIGDFAKYGLLRALSGVPGEVGQKRLGVAWWYVKGGRARSSSSGDGRLTGYLNAPERWRDLDDELFDALKWLVCRGCRSVEGIEASRILGSATFHREPVPADVGEREAWFEGVIHWLNDCDPDLVFADPDNGLYPDDGFTGAIAANRKRISPREFRKLAEGRTAIVYHHFHRRCSHDEQLREWMNELPECQYVYRWRTWVPRAFIVITKDKVTKDRLEAFAERWKALGSLVRRVDFQSEA